MQARAVLVATLLLAIGASGCLELGDDGPLSRRVVEIYDDRIEAYGNTYNASGPRDAPPAKADPRWTIHVANRGDREHAVTIVDTDNDTLVYDHVLQPSQEAQFSFPYSSNFTLYDRLTSTRDSGLFVEYQVELTAGPA